MGGKRYVSHHFWEESGNHTLASDTSHRAMSVGWDKAATALIVS